ncbi:LLM class flavin-dependent oxidoreductase [Solihabitans fulvus]|uniref:LLM class flavin-dependent oxidoreductase n=1 Tax=Solihabitans fulvus TaxID=1892852 RepID=A0A5B2XPE9_9PSEU|nr:LLM class flavin-dependent oxidoreductase [Solihabitans fulvus]KAA2265798.1 LLM class flavin-dependent oxidoreductase [Solihabitans fulvus]
MSLQLYWFLPSHGDGRTISRKTGSGSAGTRAAQRDPDLNYLGQVCGAVEQAGFAGMLVPAGMFCEDPWLLTAALAQHSSRVAFMVALRPGLLSPTLAAQMAATAQRVTGGRLLLNVVTGGDQVELARYGEWLEHDQRYEQSAEFLAIARELWAGRQVTFSGAHFRVKDALLTRPPEVPPPVFVGGSSAAAWRVAAEHGDVYLAWGEPPPRLAELFAGVREVAGKQGRAPSCGTRFHVICRDTAEEAWAVAADLVADLSPDMVAAARRRILRSDSVGQRRMADLHGDRLDGLEIYPNVWAGYGLLRPGAGAALVGSHAEVADRIEEFHRIGVRHLILSGQPHLEEAYWFGEGVMPLLRDRGLLGGGDGAAAAPPDPRLAVPG